MFYTVGNSMRILLVLTVILVLAMPAAAEQLDFTFLSATEHTYRTTTFVEDLSIDGWPPEELVSIKIILIETPSLDNAHYKKQDKILNSLAHNDDMRIFFVVACPREEFTSGYHTTKLVANALTGSKAAFRIRLLDERGNILRESFNPMPAKTLIDWTR
jgi:hypothetical protein